MKEEIFLKDNIRKFDRNLYTTVKEQIIYRIVNINNIYFYGEEISTGAIFPVYCYGSSSSKHYNGGIDFRTQSNVFFGKNYVYCPFISKENPFEFCINTDSCQKKIVNIDEINNYLKEKKNDKDWKRKINKLAEENIYPCELSLIKKLILTEKDKQLEKMKQIETLYEEEQEKIDITEIAEFGYDLSTRNDLCNVVGREEEKKKIIKSTCIGDTSILLVGPPGSGKTVIVESLALEIKNKANTWLKNKTIFYVNPSALVTNTIYNGQFETKMQRLIDFCIKNKGKIILFIDEIHMLYGLGRTEKSSTDAMNILKPYIESGDIIIIGATTKNEFKEYVANDPAFVRRLEKVDVEPPTKETNTDILLSYIKLLEQKYNIIFSDQINKTQIVEYLIDITDKKNQRVVGDILIENPTIVKRLLKDAFTEAKYNLKNEVTLEEICYAISSCDKFSKTFKEIALQEITNTQEKESKKTSNLILIKKK